jgi:hypothetical protein
MPTWRLPRQTTHPNSLSVVHNPQQCPLRRRCLPRSKLPRHCKLPWRPPRLQIAWDKVMCVPCFILIQLVVESMHRGIRVPSSGKLQWSHHRKLTCATTAGRWDASSRPSVDHHSRLDNNLHICCSNPGCPSDDPQPTVYEVSCTGEPATVDSVHRLWTQSTNYSLEK